MSHDRDDAEEVMLTPRAVVKLVFATAFQEREKAPRKKAQKIVERMLDLALARGFSSNDVKALIDRSSCPVPGIEGDLFERFLLTVPPIECVNLMGIPLVRTHPPHLPITIH